MINNILFLSKQFISIPSTKENPTALKQVLELAKKQVAEYTIERFEKNGVHSFLAYNTKTRPKKFKVILDAHLDVVPAKDSQYKQRESGGKLYGRGTYDMKSAAAAEILVFKEMAKKVNYPVALQIVTDEEIGGFNGAKHQLEQGVKCDFMIAGEGTDFGINNKAKGIIWFRVLTSGRTGHGAYLWNGENAIWKMKKFLDILEKKYPVPSKEAWQTTVNLSRIETANQTFNKIPDNCVVSLDMRYIPEESKTILNDLKRLLPAEFQLEIEEKEPAHFTAEKNPYIIKLQQATKKITGKLPPTVAKHGGSDVRHYTAAGCAGVTFGPVGVGLHTDNEWVNIKSLEDYYLILKDFLLGGPKGI